MRIAIVFLFAACSSPPPPIAVLGLPTETQCPPSGTTLTYENFAAPFMGSYCTRCHHSELVGAARQGAPTFHDFDTYFGIRGVANHVDETTAAGPAVINRGMPQDGAQPTDEERFMLGEWIACDLPE
jgi:hypothetical protein